MSFVLNKLFLKNVNLLFRLNLKRAASSALYITGDRATDMFVSLTPCLEFNFDKIKQSVKLRNIQINMDEFEEMWTFYKKVELGKMNLENKRLEIAKEIKELSKQGTSEIIQSKIGSLRNRGKLIRTDLKAIKENLWKLENDAILRAINMPNILHEKTPISEDKIIYTFGAKPDHQMESHLDTVQKYDLAEIINPQMYYLKEDAAKLEIGLMLFLSYFYKDSHFIPFSNSDFSRSVIVEGCGRFHRDPSDVFILEETHGTVPNDDNRLHLTGSASLMSFMAFHAKNIVYSSYFPLKYLCVGRNYEPRHHHEKSLFNVCQATAAQVFIATQDCTEIQDGEFLSILTLTQKLYEKLGYHFRIVYKSAQSLDRWECLRADIEMFSTSLNTYVQVGYISSADSYLSRRLVFHSFDGKQRQFPKIISGQILNFPKFLACILEHGPINDSSDIIPRCVKPFI